MEEKLMEETLKGEALMEQLADAETRIELADVACRQQVAEVTEKLQKAEEETRKQVQEAEAAAAAQAKADPETVRTLALGHRALKKQHIEMREVCKRALEETQQMAMKRVGAALRQ